MSKTEGYEWVGGNKGITLDGVPLHIGSFDSMMAVALVHLLNQQRELRAEIDALRRRSDAEEKDRQAALPSRQGSPLRHHSG